MSKFFKKLAELKSKVNTNNPSTEKLSKEGIKINIKGQRVADSIEGPNINLNTLDRDLYGKEKGPPMLNMRTRIKVWGAMAFMGLYFFACYKLILYRLKSDDINLMEREVKEDFKLKMKIEEFNKNAKTK